ncbi:TolC family protein [Leptotrichia sp. OH3620_COT-345]|uniref:TolC family protein n=1 Tax=Leptotrichia sp. OH3620_COT-345 TaxID=2491048 RepID=UPI000F647212|nr:TolC family protein [Leptotrichia sp. OH3620_COT-345]RRD40875.1 TolC family protein [Leptotrichia sp. OH3620_COT-345]
MPKSIYKRKISKSRFLFLFLISVSVCGANLDDVISEYEKKSYTTKINEANLKTYDIKEKALKKGDWNAIKFSTENAYEKSRSYDGININNSITFGILYYKNGYNFTDKKFTENKIGISKTLNDFFYSDTKHNTNVNNISRNIQKIINETSKNDEIRNLIDLYKEYKNKEKEVSQNKISVEGKKKDYNILTKKYQLGTATKFDYDLAKTEYETAQLKYENTERELKILNEKFMIYNVSIPKTEKLEDIKAIELKKEDFYGLKLSEAQKIKLNENLYEERMKKEKFDYNVPKITADAGYSFKNDSVTVGLGITKTFKLYNDTIEDLKNETEKLKLEYERKKNEILSNAGQEILNYTTYQTNVLISKKNLEISKQDYAIFFKKYELGTDTFANYVEKRNVYEKAVIDYEIAKNELAAFTRKIKYYK